jgi:hypothetical protein
MLAAASVDMHAAVSVKHSSALSLMVLVVLPILVCAAAGVIDAPAGAARAHRQAATAAGDPAEGEERGRTNGTA